MAKFISIHDVVFACDTAEEIEYAARQVRDAGWQSATVWSSPSDDLHHPDSVKTDLKILAAE